MLVFQTLANINMGTSWIRTVFYTQKQGWNHHPVLWNSCTGRCSTLWCQETLWFKTA